MIHEKRLPLAGIRVLDFGHTVMGPSCAMILADLGADVLKIEPAPGGDPTRQLQGFGMGYFGYFNRNKRSLAVDLKSDAGREIARRLVKDADVLVENFAPGTMGRLGLDAPAARGLNPRLVYPIISTACFTFGGVKVNASAQVLDGDGKIIPGLYAAGETVGLYHQVYTGSTSVLRGAVFGRLAGLDAAAKLAPRLKTAL